MSWLERALNSRGMSQSSSGSVLRLIKVAHTMVWLLFAGAILAIPIAASVAQFRLVVALGGLVMVEVMILALNGMRCPLTGLAARYTPERRANFDIYLPLWLATWNKQLFGSLYIVGLLFALARWSLQ
jgi:hypothetical protein